MTSTLPAAEPDTADPLKIAEARATAAQAEADQLRAGLGAVIDLIVERHQVGRQNCGHYPPTDQELVELETADRAYWLGIARRAGGAQ